MAIKFYSIRTREVVEALTEPQITALWSVSDRSPNVTQGQDMGWRFAPEVIVEMKRIKQDVQKLVEIAHRYNRPVEDVGEPEILQYISDKTASEAAPVAQETDYQDEYDAEVRRLEAEEADRVKEAAIAATAQTATTTQSGEGLADLEKRVELEERLAKARATQTPETTITTTKAPVTTTTTTKNPTTTTTTTKVS